MFDVDVTDQKDYTLVEQTDDIFYIRARLTKKGYYKLTIFSKYGEPQKFTEALILLIFNSNESETTSAFPLTYTTTRKYKCRLLEPLVRDIPANSEVQFQFTSKEFTNLLVNKKVHTKENGGVWRIVTETGEYGNLNLSGNPSDGSSYWPVDGFVIKSDENSMGCGSSSTADPKSDFQQIDEHARKAPSSVEESVDTLANYLAKPAKNDLEKVRALYVWICENIRYNTDAYFSGNLSSVATNGEDVLKCKSSVCEGYARLFEALCLSLGITCKKISGYAKGYGHNAGDVISYDQKTNHAWNVVELDGTWKFIETTWGAGYTDKNKKFNKKFTNFFFLTPPHNFITDHFPYMKNNIEESKQWQLLENPLTLEVYSKSIQPSQEARHFGIAFPSHPYEMITVENSCTITVESKADVLLKVWYDLYDDHGSTCNESVIVLKENNSKYRVTIRPRGKGRCKLHVYATIDKCDDNPQLVAYIIDCVSVEADFMAYPPNRGYYGPQLDYIQRGFHRPEVIQPFHMCKNGEFELEVKTTATPEITTTMFDGDGTDQKDYTLVEQTDNTIYIRARFTKKGYYKLTIFSKFGESEKYTEALVLLIFNSNESETTSSFPLTYTATREYKCRLLEPLVRDIPANSEVQFQFTSPELTKLLVNKKVHTKENGDVWRIVAETGDSGNLKLSGNPSDGSSYSAVYGFVIKS